MRGGIEGKIEEQGSKGHDANLWSVDRGQQRLLEENQEGMSGQRAIGEPGRPWYRRVRRDLERLTVRQNRSGQLSGTFQDELAHSSFPSKAIRLDTIDII